MDESDEPILVLGPSGRRRRVTRILLLLGVLPAALVGVAAWRGEGQSAVQLVVQNTVVLATVLGGIGALSLRITVTVRDSGLQVRGGASRHRGDWRWEDLLEVALVTTQQVAPTVGIRPRGSVWTVPGPTTPALVAPALGGPEALAEARRILAQVCRRHGVPFSTGPDGVGSAPPGSPLRRDGC